MYAFFTKNNNKNKQKIPSIWTHLTLSQMKKQKQDEQQTENRTQKTKSRFQMQF